MPIPKSKSKKVFISYAHEDRAYAERLYGDLIRVEGIDPWLDSECLRPGQRWKTEISKAIRGSDFFIALLSSNSLGKRGYVQKELREALEILDQIPESDSFLIPVRLEDCSPTHPRLLEIHWVDFFPVYESGLRSLLLTVQPVLPIAATAAHEKPDWFGVQPEDLAQTGWGIIMPHDSDPSIREALAPLLRHRQAQASILRPDLFREFTGVSGYHRGQSKLDFLASLGAGPGLPRPEKVPYYLLIVGSPEQIPFSFQYELGLQHRVGRLHFDSLEEYENYAMSLVVAETQKTKQKTAALFGTQSHVDAIKSATTGVISQLAELTRDRLPDWRVDTLLGDLAVKEGLRQLLGPEPPTFLFVMTHGLVFPPGHAREKAEQGSIVCSNWLGPEHDILRPEHYFSAADVAESANLQGTVVFCIGSMSAGTSWQDEINLGARPNSEPFISALPQRLLGRKKGALAFIGHINDIYLGSFEGFGRTRTLLFAEAFHRLLSGLRVGASLSPFSTRFADLAVSLSNVLDGVGVDGKAEETGLLALLRQAMVEMRNYVVIGDPAAKSPIDGPSAELSSPPAFR